MLAACQLSLCSCIKTARVDCLGLRQKKFTCVDDFVLYIFRAISTMPTGPFLVKFGGISKVSEISFIFNNDDELQVASCALYSNL